MALVEALNALGVAFASNPSSSQSTQELGSHLTIAALAIQLGVIVIFVFLAAILHRRAVSTPLITLYVSMSLILIRCIYRSVEHSGNTTVRLDDPESLKQLSPILRYEWFFYMFEATIMLLNSALWNVWNPGRYLPRDYHVYLAQDGITVLEGEDKPDGRPLLVKAASILTFGILFRKKRENRPFEELNNYPDARR
ncbi:hypothetical protein MMC10_002640 [Thelotrema lepadinum]|nr:hypothetical protein [Thelotrema lepadinum]